MPARAVSRGRHTAGHRMSSVAFVLLRTVLRPLPCEPASVRAVCRRALDTREHDYDERSDRKRPRATRRARHACRGDPPGEGTSEPGYRPCPGLWLRRLVPLRCLPAPPGGVHSAAARASAPRCRAGRRLAGSLTRRATREENPPLGPGRNLVCSSTPSHAAVAPAAARAAPPCRRSPGRRWRLGLPGRHWPFCGDSGADREWAVGRPLQGQRPWRATSAPRGIRVAQCAVVGA